MAEVDVEVVKRLGELSLLVESRPQLVRRECAGSVALGSGEFCLASDGGLVNPASGDRFGEDVDGGLFAGNGDVGVVVMASACEGDVDASDVAGTVEDEDGSVDGAALGGVAGLGVAELDMLRDVVGGEPDGSGGSGSGDVATAVQSGDGPVIAVADHVALVG